MLKIKLFVIAVLFFSALGAADTPHPSTEFWGRMNDTAGPIDDFSGKNNNPDVSGDPVFQVSGVSKSEGDWGEGLAIDFDGNGDIANHTSSSEFQFNASQSFAFGAWFKSTDKDKQRIISRQGGGTTGDWWIRSRDSWDGDASVEIGCFFRSVDDTIIGEYIDTNGSHLDGNYHHIICSWDDTNNEIDIFYDGKLNGTIWKDQGTLGKFNNSNIDWYIGGEPSSTGGNNDNQYWNGSIEEPRIWSSHINSSEAEDLYKFNDIGFQPSDNTKPEVSIINPSNTTYGTHETLLNVSSNESVSKWIYETDGKNTTFTPNGTVDFESGKNKLTVYAEDSSGNIGKASVTLTVDASYEAVWGDMHIHLNYSSHGNNDIGTSQNRCQQYGLDFCNQMDHNTDLSVSELDYMINQSKQVSNPGEYIQFAGGEWTQNNDNGISPHRTIGFDNLDWVNNDKLEAAPSQGGSLNEKEFIEQEMNSRPGEYFLMPHHNLEAWDTGNITEMRNWMDEDGEVVVQAITDHTGRTIKYGTVQKWWSKGLQVPAIGASDKHCKNESCQSSKWTNDTNRNGVADSAKWYLAGCFTSNHTRNGIYNAITQGRCSYTQGFNHSIAKVKSGNTWMGQDVNRVRNSKLLVNMTFRVEINKDPYKVDFVRLERDNKVVWQTSNFKNNSAYTVAVNVNKSTNAIWGIGQQYLYNYTEDVDNQYSTFSQNNYIDGRNANTTSNPIFINGKSVSVSNSKVEVIGSTSGLNVEHEGIARTKTRYDGAIWKTKVVEASTTALKQSGTTVRRNVTVNSSIHLTDTHVTFVPVKEEDRQLFADNGTEVTNNSDYNLQCTPSGSEGHCNFTVPSLSTKTLTLESTNTGVNKYSINTEREWKNGVFYNTTASKKFQKGTLMLGNYSDFSKRHKYFAYKNSSVDISDFTSDGTFEVGVSDGTANNFMFWDVRNITNTGAVEFISGINGSNSGGYSQTRFHLMAQSKSWNPEGFAIDTQDGDTDGKIDEVRIFDVGNGAVNSASISEASAGEQVYVKATINGTGFFNVSADIDEDGIYEVSIGNDTALQTGYLGEGDLDHAWYHDDLFIQSTSAGNYTSPTFEYSTKQSWNKINFDVENLKQSYSLNATFQVLDGSGSVIDQQLIELNNGEKTYNLSVNSSKKARFLIKGLTSNAVSTWRINSSTVYSESTTSAPSVKIHSPQNTTYSSSSIDLNVTSDEAIDTWKYSLDGAANQTFTPNTTLSSLSDGTHTVNVYANDTNGNIGKNSVTFTVNANAYVVINDSVQINQSGNNAYINVTNQINVSSLSIYSTATELGGINWSITGSTTDRIDVKLSMFSDENFDDDYFVNYSLSTASGNTVTNTFSSITQDTIYQVYKNGSFFKEVQADANKLIEYSYDVASSAYTKFSLRRTDNFRPGFNSTTYRFDQVNSIERLEFELWSQGEKDFSNASGTGTQKEFTNTSLVYSVSLPVSSTYEVTDFPGLSNGETVDLSKTGSGVKGSSTYSHTLNIQERVQKLNISNNAGNSIKYNWTTKFGNEYNGTIGANSKVELNDSTTGDYLDNNTYNFSVEQGEIVLGFNYTGTFPLEVNNTVGNSFQSVATEAAIPSVKWCSQTNNSQISIGSESTKNFSVGHNCNPGNKGNPTQEIVNLSTDSERVWYNSTDMKIYTNYTESNPIVIRADKDNLKNPDNRDGGSLNAFVEGTEAGNNSELNVTDTGSYFRITVGDDFQQSSLHTDDDEWSVTYTLSGDSTDSTGGGGGGGGDGTDSETVYFGQAQTSDGVETFNVNFGTEVVRNLTVTNTAQESLTVSLDSGSQGICQYIKVRPTLSASGWSNAGSYDVPAAKINNLGTVQESSIEVPVRFQVPNSTVLRSVGINDYSCSFETGSSYGTAESLVMRVEQGFSLKRLLDRFNLVGEYCFKTGSVTGNFSGSSIETGEKVCVPSPTPLSGSILALVGVFGFVGVRRNWF